MPHFYFDSRDGDTITPDDTGVTFDTPEQATREGTRALAELAKDVLPGSRNRVLGITVRDGERELFDLQLSFDVQAK